MWLGATTSDIRTFSSLQKVLEDGTSLRPPVKNLNSFPLKIRVSAEFSAYVDQLYSLAFVSYISFICVYSPKCFFFSFPRPFCLMFHLRKISRKYLFPPVKGLCGKQDSIIYFLLFFYGG